MLRAPVPLVLLVLLFPLSCASGPAFAPRLVAAADASGPSTLVSWLPGEQAADAYNVYGLSPDAPPAWLGSSASRQALVPAGFAGYAVSGVRAGVESPLVAATTAAAAEDCIAVGPVYVIIRCMPEVRRETDPAADLYRA